MPLSGTGHYIFYKMIKNLKIGTKITAVILAVVLITLAAISFIAFNFGKQSIDDQSFENLRTINSLKADKINNYLSQVKANTGYIAQSDMWSSLADSSATGDDMSSSVEAFLQAYSYEAATVLEEDGAIVFSTGANPHETGTFFDDPTGKIRNESKKGAHLSSLFMEGEKSYIYAVSPLESMNRILLVKVNLAPVYAILADTIGLGNTGESYIGRKYKHKAVYLNPLRHTKKLNLIDGPELGSPKEFAMQQAVQGKSGSTINEDYRNNKTLAVWQTVNAGRWGLVTKMDMDELHAASNQLMQKFIIAGLIILLISLMIALIFSRFLIRPLLALKSTISLLGKGILPAQVERETSDEIGEMALTMNNLVQGLKRTALFAHKIGEGDFESQFKPLSNSDTLGNALLTMRSSIQEAEMKDKERNWIVTGVAEIGEILRSHTNLNELGDAVVAYVTKKINGIQGAFYVVDDEDEQDAYIEMKASYAYNKKKHINARFRFSEGLVGQSAIEQDTLLRTEIPRDYVTITSGLLGEQRPKSILVVPLITNEQVFGVMEFAGFDKFTPSQVKFVQEISLIIARTIFNIKVNTRTSALLEESQKMSNELQIQQEVLRQNAEEMEATQEELKRSNHRLEDQVEEVNRTQKRMQLLLENASEVITIYEEDGTVRYISPSVEKITGYMQSELIGKKDIVNIIAEGTDAFKGMFRSLIADPATPIIIQFEYKRKNGEAIWLEAKGTNLLADTAVQGIIVNSRDITERRRAEQEQRMRSQMQALSENSPDLITRIDQQGTFFYINPVIETYTGHNQEHFLRKSIHDVALTPSITDSWLKILQDVNEQNAKVSTEMDFPSVMGDRVMQVNAIPEYNQDQQIESVLVVSHDITDRKLIELEVQTKNKKITESINYAKRIQGAILPNNKVINQVMPESFILYKAKDVVSGDFPWFMQMGDDIYIAAVDCTGHGVPGALISLIGYFLLNDIVRSRKISNPGLILDQLDEGVTQTLRQDRDDSKTKDGMDIALCKINLKKGEVEYAGAHRSLYFMKDGVLEEIKGNKFPIGGGKYRNQTNFTNTKINVGAKDSIYFCSDGFPDQFGGEDNRKFGPKRLRDLIEAHHHKPMKEVHQVFDTEWENWRGEFKQTDDVLLIGLKF